MKFTKNFNFKKPEPLDTVNINDLNDSFDLIDEKLKETEQENKRLDSTFKELIINAGNSNAEIVDARGQGFDTLRDRLDNSDNEMNNLDDRVEKIETLQEENETEISTDKGYVVCGNANNGQIEWLKVEGKTLVNLNKTSASKTINSNTDQTYTINLARNLLANTTYTFVITLSSYTGSGAIKFAQSKASDGSTNYQNGTLLNKGNGVHCATFTPDYEYKSARIYFDANIESGSSVTISNLIILEGDYAQNPPSYFEGLKSVGDGVDKIEVLSQGKNLFNKNSITLNSRLSVENGELISSYNTGNCVSDFINIKGNQQYYYYYGSTYVNRELVFYDINKQFISSLTGANVINFTSPYNARYIRANCFLNNLDVTQLEEGSVTTPYALYKGNKKQILFKNSTGTYEKPVLRSTGTVSDTIEKHSDGKYYFHKRCGEVIFDGSSDENWLLNTSSETTQSFRYPYSVDMTDLICDKFVQDDSSHNGVEGILISKINTPNEFSIEILKTKLSSVDVTGFKKWLQSNPVTVVYALATEEIYECTNLDLNAYEGETSVICNSNIPLSSMSFKIANHISNVVNIVKDRNNSLENQVSDVLNSQGKVLDMFKAVLAGDMQTLAYELYPEDFKEEIKEEIAVDEDFDTPATLEEPPVEEQILEYNR